MANNNMFLKILFQVVLMFNLIQ